MPADDVVKVPFTVVRQRQTTSTSKPICLEEVGDIARCRRKAQSASTDRVIQKEESQSKEACKYRPAGIDPPQCPSADFIEGWRADILSSGDNSDRLADNFKSSWRATEITTSVPVESSDVDSGSSNPDWLTARRRYLDNQVLRCELRCQRADELVSEQFQVVLRK